MRSGEESNSSHPKPGDGDVTTLLHAVHSGDPQAAEALLPIVYDELRRLASSRMAALAPGQTLQPTALVHEAYLKLVGRQDPGWNGRGHFFGAAARAMREILVDRARRRSREKRGGGHRRVSLSDTLLLAADFDGLADELLDLDGALQRLEIEHPRHAEVVLLRYFAGLGNEDAAAALGVSARTVERDWRFARAWLHRELSGEASRDGATPNGDPTPDRRAADQPEHES